MGLRDPLFVARVGATFISSETSFYIISPYYLHKVFGIRSNFPPLKMGASNYFAANKQTKSSFLRYKSLPFEFW